MLNMDQQKHCTDCVNYRRHYVLKGKKPMSTNSRHCILQYRNGRFRKAEKVCEEFRSKEKPD